ncbi:hypothetical protein C9374_000503 [Naegleria lovaniensis]|uniref:Pentatricopeptide repeat-containing protein n=1 Tax=Naegleria lovaniensis TaxID=51637 RepID=A0AA88GZ39_NAELO|nr:uncharacterized protein C9374_000503 [Naegleria lovaniensis]KAG2388339.1 hypothetical protein C9374_000503 [Naegleria lovaniensis]
MKRLVIPCIEGLHHQQVFFNSMNRKVNGQWMIALIHDCCYHERHISLDYVKNAFKLFKPPESEGSLKNTDSANNPPNIPDKQETKKKKIPIDNEIEKLKSLESKNRYDNIINYYMLRMKGKPFEKPDRDVDLYYYFLYAFFRKGQPQSALDCFNELKERIHKPIPTKYSNLITKSLLEAGRGEEALTILKEMQDDTNLKFYPPNEETYVTFFDYFSKNGALHSALSMIEYIHKTFTAHKQNSLQQKKLSTNPVAPNREVFQHLFKLLSDQGKMKLATNFLYIMTKFYNIEPNANIYDNFVSGFCKSGDISSARTYVNLIKNLHKSNKATPTVVQHCYNEIIRAACQVPDIKLAEELMKEFHSLGFKANTFIANSFIEAYTSIGEIQLALDVFQKMKDAGVALTPLTYSLIITFFTRQRNFNVHYEGHINICCNFLLRGYLEAGQLTSAVKFFEKMKANNILLTSHTYNALINGFCKAQDHTRAIEILHEMKKKQIGPDIYSITPIIRILLQKGDFDTAAALFKKSYYVFKVVPNFYIYCMFMQYGTIHKRSDIFDTYYYMGLEFGMKSPSDNAIYFFNQAIQHHAIMKNAAECERVLEDMNQLLCTPDDTSFLYIGVAWLFEQNIVKARSYFSRISKAKEKGYLFEHPLSLEEYKFILLELIEGKRRVLANKLLYDLLLPLGKVDLEIIKVGMEINIQNFERVKELYDSLPKFGLNATRVMDDIIIRAKSLSETNQAEQVVPEECIRVVRY